MGRHLIRAQIKAGEADLVEMLDWIAAYAAHHRDDRGRQVWEVQKRDDPEPLGAVSYTHLTLPTNREV